jgi:hypothetical protein
MSRSSLLALLLIATALAPLASAGADPVDTALDATAFPTPPSTQPGSIDPRSAEVFRLPTVELQPTDAPARDTPGVTTPDVQPTPSIPVADLDYVGTLHVADRDGELCVDLTVGDLGTQEVFCLNEAVPAVPRGDLPLGVDAFVDTPPLPGAAVPNVPSVQQGALVSTAGYQADVFGTLHWDCGRMQPLLNALGEVQTYRPFPTDPETAAWLAAGGGDTVGLTVTAEIRQDGNVVRTYEVTVPLVGQALAAAGRVADPLGETADHQPWCG